MALVDRVKISTGLVRKREYFCHGLKGIFGRRSQMIGNRNDLNVRTAFIFIDPSDGVQDIF